MGGEEANQRSGISFPSVNATHALLALMLLAAILVNTLSANALLLAGKGTAVTLSASPNPSTNNQLVTFTATVSGGVPNGENVTFKDGGATIGVGKTFSGTATLKISILSLGVHSITATYAGDGVYSASTSPSFTQTVRALGTSVALVSKTNPSSYGQQVTLTATVTGNVPLGEQVTFYDSNPFSQLGTASLVAGTGGNASKGVGSIVVSTLAAGSHSITAFYPGDANFGSSTSSPVTQLVKVGTSSIRLVSSTNSSANGQPVTFTATISPNTPTLNGEVITFKDAANVVGTGTISSGIASLTTTLLSVGTHSIAATYPGDFNLTSSTSGTLTQTVNKGSGSGSTCSLRLNVTTGAPYYVSPQPIVIYYAVSKTGTCNLPNAIGTLSLSGEATGSIYASIPINVSNIISTPVTRVVTANSTLAPRGQNQAVLLLSSGVISNLSSTSFTVLQPANITLESMWVTPNITRVGSQLTVVTSLLNSAFFDAANASINMRIIAPNLSVYKTSQRIGRIPAFRNMTVAVNPGIGAVSQNQGKYTIIENLSYYSNFTTASGTYSSNALYSKNITTSYTSLAAVTAYPSQNTGYNPLVGYPIPAANIGPALVSSFPFYTDINSGINVSTNLNDFIMYDSASYPITVNVTLPALHSGRLIASAGSLNLLPNQAGTMKFKFTSSGTDFGTYVVPINVSVTAANNSTTTTQLFTLLNLNNKTAGPQVFSNVKFLNGNKNASVQMTVFNPTNTIYYNLLLNTGLPGNVTYWKNNLLPIGQNANNVTFANNAYQLSWPISQLSPNSFAQVGYTVLNLTSPRGLLFPQTFLSFTKQSNSSTFTILQIKKPPTIYANTTINLTISAIYTGTNVSFVTLALTPPIGANVINPQQNFKAIPNTAIIARFNLTTSTLVGTQVFKLITPGAFGPQSQDVVLIVQPKPLAIFELSAYLDDPRTLFGIASFLVVVISLTYGRIKRYRMERALRARSTVKKMEVLRSLEKRINVAVFDDGTIKRTFRRHQNQEGSLGGFVEESAVVGKDVYVAPTAIIENDAIISGNGRIMDNATISNNTVIRGHVVVSGNAKVGDDAELYGNARVSEEAKIYGECEIYDNAKVSGSAEVFGNARIFGKAEISGKAMVYGDADISGDAQIKNGKIAKGHTVSGGG
ncbi:MAG: Ig-like domain repeat protein [Candidatus Micrarchaeota archaeon]|nr:Ig-like domain repeat protein [Candidatus Micrarchaeota archaeon]